ncbi:MAG: RNA polymerase factor sigma-54 [Desulfovibrio sp.]|nr:RNA polymerase factor sigma-54 [Desulfovibrio sp.]
MAMELRQQLKMQQQLVMTPQLRQAIKLLQLSRLELTETVQKELLENPFLEDSPADSASEDFSDADKARNLNEALPVKTHESSEDKVYDGEVAREASWEDYLGEFSSTSRQAQQHEHEIPEEISPLEARYVAKPTLSGHLLWQLHLSTMTDRQKTIGEEIIGNLDPAGYLQADLSEIAGQLQATQDEVAEVLARVQEFDPVGVAARDGRECLLIQMRQLHYDRDPVLLDIVSNHLEDIEAHRYKPLLHKYKIDMEDLNEYIDVIHSLDPLPASDFGDGEPHYISPDVYIYKLDGEFVIILNDEGLPQLHLSSLSQMDLNNVSEKEREYCTEKIRSASWLIKSLYQRQRTLYKVTESIVRHQRAFFEEGVTKLAPLILKDIADDIDMHESTVSRITTNKYASTPYGVFELKFFFNSGLVLADGSQVGSESVKALVKKFISEEDPKTPLSDERIGEMLKEQLDVTIARRTVAKYRTQMDIPSSSRRKKR